MKTTLVAIAVLALPCGLCADEISTFRTYVDTDLCARLMLGPITPSRIECSQKSAKDNNEPVLVRLQNNMVLTVNKEKMIKPLVGQFAEVSGELKVKNGTMKLKEAKAIVALIIVLARSLLQALLRARAVGDEAHRARGPRGRDVGAHLLGGEARTQKGQEEKEV